MFLFTLVNRVTAKTHTELHGRVQLFHIKHRHCDEKAMFTCVFFEVKKNVSKVHMYFTYVFLYKYYLHCEGASASALPVHNYAWLYCRVHKHTMCVCRGRLHLNWFCVLFNWKSFLTMKINFFLYKI